MKKLAVVVGILIIIGAVLCIGKLMNIRKDLETTKVENEFLKLEIKNLKMEAQQDKARINFYEDSIIGYETKINTEKMAKIKP